VGWDFPGGDSRMGTFFIRIFSFFALFSCISTVARAIPITIEFSGTFTQATAGGCAYCGPYSAAISFDTSNGLFQQIGPDSYHFTPAALGYLVAHFSNGISINGFNEDYIAWSPGLLTGDVGSMYSHLSLYSSDRVSYRLAHAGSYCSFLSVDQFSVRIASGCQLGPRSWRRAPAS
jgi:hypothetical protein